MPPKGAVLIIADADAISECTSGRDGTLREADSAVIGVLVNETEAVPVEGDAFSVEVVLNANDQFIQIWPRVSGPGTSLLA